MGMASTKPMENALSTSGVTTDPGPSAPGSTPDESKKRKREEDLNSDGSSLGAQEDAIGPGADNSDGSSPGDQEDASGPGADNSDGSSPGALEDASGPALSANDVSLGGSATGNRRRSRPFHQLSPNVQQATILWDEAHVHLKKTIVADIEESANLKKAKETYDETVKRAKEAYDGAKKEKEKTEKKKNEAETAVKEAREKLAILKKEEEEKK